MALSNPNNPTTTDPNQLGFLSRNTFLIGLSSQPTNVGDTLKPQWLLQELNKTSVGRR